MFPANVYRIMIGCPSDVQKEVQVAKDVITRWTSVHAEQTGIVLIPINWSTNSYPEQGAHPQKILNSQLADKSDMLIGIFGARIGTPTDTAQSGTIEEIEEHIKAGKPVMLFFRRYNDTSRTSAAELAKLEAFKFRVQSQGLYWEYNTENDFEKAFSDSLEHFLSDHWLDKVSSKPFKQQRKAEFSEEEIERLKKWVTSNNSEAHSVSSKDGTTFIVGDSQYEVSEARELVRWNDFFNRLLKAGLITQSRSNRFGAPVYQLLVSAYELIDSLDKK